MNDKYEIKKITLWGLALNILLSAIKFVIGFLGNSQAVVADAAHSLSDTSTDLIILFGVKYWTAPPDSEHPYGHQKIESFITIIIGLILLFAGIGIGYSAIITINEHSMGELKLFTIAGPIISIVLKELLFRKTYQVGIKTNSSSLKANAWHHRTDALSSIPVLIAVAASLINPKLIFLDQIGAIIVAVFILKLSLEVIFSNTKELIDTGLSDEEIQNIYKIIRNHGDVKGCHKIRTRKLGSSIYIDMHLEVDGNLTVSKGHMISEQVKNVLIRENSKIIDVMIHLEPEE
ncbi:MAG: cation diffusion facilitator family transporter [Desulfobacteraceae bacterium]|nr:cation diffusion facilitator family transporter [Desulfobacteraceae bacterium]